MALQNIEIDDRTYGQLLTVMKQSIPAADMDWSDMNPSDPGVMLLELFCWLGDMLLYRMNRVPESHRERFLDLLIDPPEPVTVELTFGVTLTNPGEYTIPVGVRVATDFKQGKRYVFETIEECTFALTALPDGATETTEIVRATAREFLEVTDEEAVRLADTTDSVYQLSPPLMVFKPPTDRPAPVLLDSVYPTARYNPNPQVKVVGRYRSAIRNGLHDDSEVRADSGFDEIQFSGKESDSGYLVEYDNGSRVLKLIGVADRTAYEKELTAANISSSEEVVFDEIGARIVLNDAFDENTAIELPSAGVFSKIGGSGQIDGNSVRIIAAGERMAAIGSDTLTVEVTPESDLTRLTLKTGAYTDSFDASATGVKTVVLNDGKQAALTIEFEVTAPFNGQESQVSLRLPGVGNLVAPARWELKGSLLTRESRVDPTTGQTPLHFMVDPSRNQIRFGDGHFGARPDNDEKVVCTRYQVLQGLNALIAPSRLNLLSEIPSIPAKDIKVSNEVHARGGRNVFTTFERSREGLTEYRKQYRLITEGDFVRALSKDFNDLQAATEDPFRVLRAYAMSNHAPSSESSEGTVERTGHVTLLVVPNNPPYTQESLQTLMRPSDSSGPTLEDKKGAFKLDDAGEERLLQFLDKRRLITTRIHVIPPDLVEFNVSMTVVVGPERNTAEMKELLTERLYEFLDVFDGNFDHQGWQPGQSVYASHLYRLIGETEGVDHVESLTLSPSDEEDKFTVGLRQLPVLGKKPNIIVERAGRS